MKPLFGVAFISVAIVAAPVRGETSPASPVGAIAEAPVHTATDSALPSAPSLWRPDWRPVSWTEASVFAGLEAASLIGPLIWSKPAAPRWRGGILFDDKIQDALGWGLPTLLHFRHFSSPRAHLPFSIGVVPAPTPTGMSLSLVGSG